MTRFVIDAPTLVHVVNEGVAIHPDHRLVAPTSLRSQALGLLLTQVRAGDLTEKEAVARERDWATLQHAEYHAVAKLQADALVSVDPELVAAADGVVPLAPLEALSVP